jgi:ketosteroid isomerase-like protein
MTLEERVRTLEDIEDVRVLMARYHQACDGWDEHGTHRDPDAIAALFTEDGVWDVTAAQPAPTGHAEIAALARKLQVVPWIVHMIVSPVVEVSGDIATGVLKGILRVRMTDAARLNWATGQYQLTARRTRDGWRIASLSWETTSESERYDPSR